VAFVVGSVAPGDSLSIYGPRGVLWGRPLSDFTPGIMYFADVPAQAGTGPGAPIALTYFIKSDNDLEHASVWFPTDLTLVDNITPASVSELGWSSAIPALTLLAGAALVLKSRRRTA
jgi:hypothetical protein